MKYDIEIINIFKHDIRVHGFDFCNGQIEQIKDAIFSSFIYLPENGFDFQGKYLRLRYDGGWYDDKDNYLSGAYYDEKDKAVYGILHVVPSDYYGIDYDGVFYYKKPSGDWQRFEKDKKENKYLYEDSVWQSSLFQRRIKQDLMRECYTD